MGKRRPIPQRTTVYLAGEGASEQGYGRWLNRLAHHQGVPVAFTVEKLQGGDPLDLVEQAVEKLDRLERQRGRFAVRGLLLDRDLYGDTPNRDQQAHSIAKKKRIHLIWQHPTHEGLLLRHFDQYRTHAPPTAAEALKRLIKVWPNYIKGLDATGYEQVLSNEHLTCGRSVCDELEQFLVRCGWKR